MLLTGLFPMAHSNCFHIQPRNSSPGMVPPKWAEPFHNKHKLIKCPKDFPMCQYDGGNFSNEVSCSLVCQVDN